LAQDFWDKQDAFKRNKKAISAIKLAKKQREKDSDQSMSDTDATKKKKHQRKIKKEQARSHQRKKISMEL